MHDFMDKETLILKTQIELSTHRVKVIKAFEDADVLRPKEIAVMAGMNPNNVSRSLGQLKKMDLIILTQHSLLLIILKNGMLQSVIMDLHIFQNTYQ